MTSSKKLPILNVPAPTGAKPSVYGRFIPREELNAFAAWNPDALSGAPTTEASGMPRAPEPEVPKATPAELLSAKLHATRQQGYQDGYRDGMAALEAFKQSCANQLNVQFSAITQSLCAQMDDLQQDMARALAVTATQLAKQMVRAELQTRPELVSAVANEALEALLLSAKHITVHVHPNDIEFVTRGAAEVLTARGGRLISDACVSPGGCLVESDIGVVDASMQARWRRAAAAVGCDQGWDDVEPESEKTVVVQPATDLSTEQKAPAQEEQK
jgi:flagellar assembly protein FliH